MCVWHMSGREASAVESIGRSSRGPYRGSIPSAHTQLVTTVCHSSPRGSDTLTWLYIQGKHQCVSDKETRIIKGMAAYPCVFLFRCAFKAFSPICLLSLKFAFQPPGYVIVVCYFHCSFMYCEIRSHYVTVAGLELTEFCLPPPLKCWD